MKQVLVRFSWSLDNIPFVMIRKKNAKKWHFSKGFGVVDLSGRIHSDSILKAVALNYKELR